MIHEHKDPNQAIWDGKHPVSIMVDNVSAIHLSRNPSNHRASRHIELKYHFTRAMTKAGKIRLVFVSSKANVADAFTKALAKGPFEAMRAKLLHQCTNLAAAKG